MRTATTVALYLTRLCGVVLIVLGLLFWSGNAYALVPVHMLTGIVLVLTLWTLAGLAAAARVNPGLVALAVVWGLIVPIFGLTQTSILPGGAHWIIQVLHLAVGLTALGLAQALGTRILRGTRGAKLALQA